MSYSERFPTAAQSDEFLKAFATTVTASALSLSNLGLRVLSKYLTGEAIGITEIVEHVRLVDHPSDDLANVLDSWTDNVGEISRAFGELLHHYRSAILGQKGLLSRDSGSQVKFVIIIDDLDRCLPDTTITLLEGIKNFLTVADCIFVLGLNHHVVYQGIKQKYGGLEVNGREYLEKIINYAFFVPEPDPKRLSLFVEDYLMRLIVDNSEQRKYSLSISEFGQILEQCSFNNPRKIKRILNRYLFFIQRNSNDWEKYDNQNIARLIVIAEYYPELYSLLMKDWRAVVDTISKIDSAQFSAEDFERRFGANISPIQAQISKMKELFRLRELTGAMKHSVDVQVRAVYTVSRFL